VTALIHKRLLIGAFAILSLYASAVVVVTHDDILKAFFDYDPIHANISWGIIVVAPASCIYIAVAVHKNHHWVFYVLPAVHAMFILGLYGAIPMIYLVWWHVTRARTSAA
jgi:hypothetical protein